MNRLETRPTLQEPVAVRSEVAPISWATYREIFRTRAGWLRFGQDLWLLLRVILAGWWYLGRRAAQLAVALLRGRSLAGVGFVLALAGLVITAIAPWVWYESRLSTTEIIYNGSNARFWFFLPGPVGAWFYIFGGRWRTVIFPAMLILIACLYAAGMVFPNPVHTHMKLTSDYHFTPWIYAYAACSLAAGLISRPALGEPLLPLHVIRAYLLERPAATSRRN